MLILLPTNLKKKNAALGESKNIIEGDDDDF
jgi:hypothetical protein